MKTFKTKPKKVQAWQFNQAFIDEVVATCPDSLAKFPYPKGVKFSSASWNVKNKNLTNITLLVETYDEETSFNFNTQLKLGDWVVYDEDDTIHVYSNLEFLMTFE